MPDTRRASVAPWITALVAGIVLVALLLLYFLRLRPDQDKVIGDLTGSEADAVNAAAAEMANLSSFRRAEFDADYRRALDGATGALRSDVQKNRASTLSAMNNGKFDIIGRITHKALEGPVSSGRTKGYVVLVTLEGSRSNAPGQVVPQRLSVTVIRKGGKWLASDVQNIGVEG